MRSDPARLAAALARVLATTLTLVPALSASAPAQADVIANTPLLPRPRGDSFVQPVTVKAGGGLHLQIQPGALHNAVVRVFSPQGNVLADLRTADDGSFDYSLSPLPWEGNYQIQVVTAAPGIAMPGAGSGVVSFTPWSDVTQEIDLEKAYLISAPYPKQQAVLSFASGGRPREMICQLATTSGATVPMAAYMFGPDGRKVRPENAWMGDFLFNTGPSIDFKAGSLPHQSQHQLVVIFPKGSAGTIKVQCSH